MSRSYAALKQHFLCRWRYTHTQKKKCHALLRKFAPNINNTFVTERVADVRPSPAGKQRLRHMLQIVDTELNMLEYWMPLQTYGCGLGLFHRIYVIHSVSTWLEQGEASRGCECESYLPVVPGRTGPVAFMLCQHCIKVEAAVATKVTECRELFDHNFCGIWSVQWLPCPFAFLYLRSCRAA